MAAKTKTRKNRKVTDGDELIDDDATSVAVAKNPAKAKSKASSNGRKVTSKSKAKKTSVAKASRNGTRPRASVVHKAPKVGSKFTAKYKGKTYTMTVKKGKDGIAYVVKGKQYKTPSAAAASVIDAGQKNGWTFWGIE